MFRDDFRDELNASVCIRKRVMHSSVVDCFVSLEIKSSISNFVIFNS